jgi:hypothetical protein
MSLDCRICVATWNVGGKTPDPGLNLEDFLQVEDSADIYVCGYEEHTLMIYLAFILWQGDKK